MLLERLAGLLNRNIAAATQAQELCKRLEGRSFAVNVEGAPLRIVASVRGGALHLSQVSDSELASGAIPDASVCGSPLALLGLLRDASATRLRSGTVAIAGDAEVAQAFYEMLRAARPDFEEELSRVVGDVAAHQIGNVVRGIAGWGRKAAQTASANVAEYLQEESRDLIARPEMEEFLSEVDRVREAADRLEARIDLFNEP